MIHFLVNFVKKLCASNPKQMIRYDKLPIEQKTEVYQTLLTTAENLQNWASPLIKRFGKIKNDTLNNDLEGFFEDLCHENDKKGITETPIKRKLVLYKMLEDDFLFMKSDCKRFTVYLK